MKKALLFVAAVVLADRLLGLGLGALYRRCLTGENGGVINYALRQDADVLVLGSSRAQHHVVPSILSQKLGLRTFNAGNDGQDFLYAMMLFDVWGASHPAPKAVLLETDPLTFERSQDELQRTSVFEPFADRDARVRQIVLQRGRFERYKLLSHAYPYNGKVLAILKNQFVRPSPSFDGYVGIAPSQRADDGWRPIDNQIPVPDLHTPFWDLKIALLNHLLVYCRDHGTRLFLVHSPHYGENPALEQSWRMQIQSLIAQHPGVEFIDSDTLFAHDFANRPDLFYDSIHLNDGGARIFSGLLAQELARRLPPTSLVGHLPKNTGLSRAAGTPHRSLMPAKDARTEGAGPKNG